MNAVEDEVHIRWIVSEQHLEEVKEDFEDQGGEIIEEPEVISPEEIDQYPEGTTEFVTPILILVVALSAGALITILSDIVLDHKYPGGSVWDVRGDEPTHWTDPTLERGTIMIIADDGPQIYHPPQRKAGLEALTKVLTGKDLSSLK